MRDRDEALVREYLATRSEEPFRQLYRSHSPYLFGLALRVCGGRRGEAEEALQEAWIRAAAKLDGFRWDSALRTWLAGIVVNCCRELRRRRPPPGPPLALVDERSADLDLPGAVDGRLDLGRLLDALPESQRIVIVLFAIEGYTHEEIGGLLGIPPGTSKSRLFEARRTLRGLREAHRRTGDR
jgi:RNA polymerase sigma-70 factor (ECF subfamily)